MKYLIDKTEGKLDEIKAFAETHPAKESFYRCLNSLNQKIISNPDHFGDYIELYADWAPYSLNFVHRKKGEFGSRIVGGIIYHGKVDGKQANNLSVTLDPNEGWQIHT